MEIFVLYVESTGEIKSSGLIFDGSNMVDRIDKLLIKYSDYAVVFLPIQDLPNPLVSKIENGELVPLSVEDYAANDLIEETNTIELNLKKTTIGMFKMIRAIWETGVSKGVWSASDIEDTDLKQQYTNWCAALDRYDEING